MILIFLSAVSHLFSTMNMYYLPTLKKQLKEKKKKQLVEEGDFSLKRGFIQAFFPQTRAQVKFVFTEPLPMLEGGKKNLPKCQNPVSGSLLLQGPSGAKPSFLLIA